MSNENTYKIAAIGPYDLVSIFKAFDIDCFAARRKEDTLEKVKELKKEKYAVILIVEDLLVNITEEEKKIISSKTLPTILLIPSLHVKGKASEDKIKMLAEKAVGFDIFKNN